MQKIVPFLWFDGNAEEAVDHYVSIFKGSKILSVKRLDTRGLRPEGTVVVATFQLEGQQFMALNGGPKFKFTEAISLYVSCETQAEVDALWERLSAGGTKGQCGWLKDKFGVSWQVIPTALGELMSDQDPQKSARVMQAMLQMGKIDIAQLKQAHAGV